MRHLFLVVDVSRAMAEKDLKPERLTCTLKVIPCCNIVCTLFVYLLLLLSQVLEKFVAEFFDQNPISQMGIIATRKGRAEKMAELNGIK